MGGNRCRVEPGEPALDLARHIAAAAHLAFAGLQAYHGSAHPRCSGAQTASSAQRSLGAAPAASSSKSVSGVYTKLQCGSYIVMDADYGRNLDRDGAPTKAFEPSLFV